MTDGTPAETEWQTDRRELAESLVELVASAPTWPLPFAGDYLQFHAYFGDRLVADIDPCKVTHQFPPNRTIGGQNVTAADFVLGRGPWKPLLEPLDRSVIHREVVDVRTHGEAYRETEGHAALVARMEAGDPGIRNLQNLDTIERIDCYFEDLVRLIASIRSKGYRRRPGYKGLHSAEEAAKASSPVRPVVVELMESEIGMAIDNEGRLIRVGPGNHRMAIARQLGLARVSVEFRLFHVAWVRRQMAACGRGPLRSIIAGVNAIGLR